MAMKKVGLDQELIIRLYFCIRQAQLSLHRGMGANWDEFRNFYTEERRKTLSGVLQQLRARIGEVSSDTVSEVVPRIVPARDWPLVWDAIMLGLFGRWRTSRWFRWYELDFMNFLLTSFMRLLALPKRPDCWDGLIALRMALARCEGIIELHSWGIPEIGRAADAEHFYQAEWKPHVALDDLLRRPGIEHPVPSTQG